MSARVKKILHMCFLLLIALMLFPFPARCDRQGKDYIIGPGDVLEIRVWDHDDLTRRVVVSQEGAITYPFIGRVIAANHSVFELETILQKKLADGYLVAPQVNVTVAEYVNQKIFLFGQVNKPGVYTLRKKINLLELVSEAGGFTENRGSTCIIVRPRSAKAGQGPISLEQASKNEIIKLNLDDLIAGEGNINNAYVKPGDSVYVKEAANIYVIGEVDKPGKFKWVPGLTVLQAISLAGGGTPRAAINRASITRTQNGKEREYRAKLGESVLPNDVIKVPESYF